MNVSIDPITAGKPALAPRLPKSYAGKKRIVLDPSTDLASLRAKALREQARFAGRYFGVSVTVLNDLTVALREMFEISAKDQDGVALSMGGRYGVHAYRIEYVPREIRTRVIGFRQESYEGDAFAVGANVSQSTGMDKQKAQGGGQAATTLSAVPLGS